MPFRDLAAAAPGETGAAVAARVLAARERQAARYDGVGPPREVQNRRYAGAGCHADVEASPDGREAGLDAGRLQGSAEGGAGRLHPAHLTNARAPAGLIRAVAVPDAQGRRLLEAAMVRFVLSARVHDRILRVARTIADLEGVANVRSVHIAEAIQYRCLDRSVGFVPVVVP